MDRRDESKLGIYLAQRRALISYVTPIVGDQSRAEDIVQDAYIRFMPGTGAAQNIDAPISYLYRIVRNLALDWRRKYATEVRRAKGEPEFWMIPATPQTPEELLLHKEDLEHVISALGDLPEQSRIALEMHRFGGYTLHEIAERLGVSVATAQRIVRDGVLWLTANLPARDS